MTFLGKPALHILAHTAQRHQALRFFASNPGRTPDPTLCPSALLSMERAHLILRDNLDLGYVLTPSGKKLLARWEGCVAVPSRLAPAEIFCLRHLEIRETATPREISHAAKKAGFFRARYAAEWADGHLRKLRQAGLVENDPACVLARYRITESGRRAVTSCSRRS